MSEHRKQLDGDGSPAAVVAAVASLNLTAGMRKAAAADPPEAG